MSRGLTRFSVPPRLKPNSYLKSIACVKKRRIPSESRPTLSYTQRKTGRNVTHLNFKIDAKEAAPKAVKRPSLTGESWEVARERLRAERGRA